MTDIRIVIEPSELTDLYGVNNDNVSFLSRLFPQLKLVARGTELRAMGDEGQLEAFSAFFERMRQFLHKYGRLRTDDLLRLWEEDAQDIGEEGSPEGDLILYGRDGTVSLAQPGRPATMLEGNYTYISDRCCAICGKLFVMALSPSDIGEKPFLLAGGRRFEVDINGFISAVARGTEKED